LYNTLRVAEFGADKEVTWVGSSREDLSAFPSDAKSIAGHQLHRVQQGKDPDHWKPMTTVDSGVAEIIVETGDAFRVFYVAKFPEAIYVLHAFQKNTQQTAKADIDKGRKRYSKVLASRVAAKKDMRQQAKKQNKTP
jgi:phage-related protein